ncbi:MAG: S-methyl-5'-thioadenosine phosphorylase [Armatimonadaceae bacterium]
MSSGFPQAEIGIFGGSGLYALLDSHDEVTVDTPYGPPSDALMIGNLAGKTVAFLPRHGRGHTIAPHKINYRANVWAMKALGVNGIIAPSAVGSLQAAIHPGSMVVCDQFVDRTKGRADTFYDGDRVIHVSPADPYCPILRHAAIHAAESAGVNVHHSGTLVVINGPRFSTKAESQWFTNNGWDVIGMTGYPEAMLAREVALPYVNISLVTDFDAGLVAGAEPVSHAEVMRVFAANIGNVRKVLVSMVQDFPDTSASPARTALDGH